MPASPAKRAARGTVAAERNESLLPTPTLPKRPHEMAPNLPTMPPPTFSPIAADNLTTKTLPSKQQQRLQQRRREQQQKKKKQKKQKKQSSQRKLPTEQATAAVAGAAKAKGKQQGTIVKAAGVTVPLTVPGASSVPYRRPRWAEDMSFAVCKSGSRLQLRLIEWEVRTAEDDSFLEVTVGELPPDGAAAEAGLMEGDVLLAVDGKRCAGGGLHMATELIARAGNVVHIKVRRTLELRGWDGDPPGEDEESDDNIDDDDDDDEEEEEEEEEEEDSGEEQSGGSDEDSNEDDAGSVLAPVIVASAAAMAQAKNCKVCKKSHVGKAHTCAQLGYFMRITGGKPELVGKCGVIVRNDSGWLSLRLATSKGGSKGGDRVVQLRASNMTTLLLTKEEEPAATKAATKKAKPATAVAVSKAPDSAARRQIKTVRSRRCSLDHTYLEDGDTVRFQEGMQCKTHAGKYGVVVGKAATGGWFQVQLHEGGTTVNMRRAYLVKIGGDGSNGGGEGMGTRTGKKKAKGA